MIEPRGYKTILADPPWPYKRTGKYCAGRYYDLMKIEDIIALPVDEWTADDAVLFLWVTNGFLPWGFPIIKNWGFEYKTCFTWAKNKAGPGYWARGQTEHCLFAVKPKAKILLPGNRRSTLIQAVVGRHSVKPSIMYDIAESMGGEPRLEMFQRKYTDLFPVRDGWDVWGDESIKGETDD